MKATQARLHVPVISLGDSLADVSKVQCTITARRCSEQREMKELEPTSVRKNSFGSRRLPLVLLMASRVGGSVKLVAECQDIGFTGSEMFVSMPFVISICWFQRWQGTAWFCNGNLEETLLRQRIVDRLTLTVQWNYVVKRLLGGESKSAK
jgi:hypothetical protein